MTPTAVQQYLTTGEKLLWSGRPRTGLVFRSSDLVLVPFGLVWAGFAVFWESTVLATNGPLFFKLWGIPFLVAGAYITIGRFLYDAWRRAHTEYAITSERVLIVRHVGSGSVQSVGGANLNNMTLQMKADGSGTLTFGPTSFATSIYAGTAWPAVKQPPSFEMIPDAKRVYEMVRATQKAQATPGAS